METNGRKSEHRASPCKGARGRGLGARETGAQDARTGTAKLPNPAEHPAGHPKDGREMDKSWKDTDPKGCKHPPKNEGGSGGGQCARQSWAGRGMRWCLGHVDNGKTCRVLLTPEVRSANTQRNTKTNETENPMRNTRKGGRRPLPGGGTPAGVPGEWRAMPKGGAERTQSGRWGARSATERGRGGPPRPRPPKALPAMGAARDGGARCARGPRTHADNEGEQTALSLTRTNNGHYVTSLAINIMSHFRAERTTPRQRDTRGVPPRRRGRCAKCRADGNVGAPARGSHADVTESIQRNTEPSALSPQGLGADGGAGETMRIRCGGGGVDT